MPGERNHAAQESKKSKHRKHPIWRVEHLDNAVVDAKRMQGSVFGLEHLDMPRLLCRGNVDGRLSTGEATKSSHCEWILLKGLEGMFNLVVRFGLPLVLGCDNT